MGKLALGKWGIAGVFALLLAACGGAGSLSQDPADGGGGGGPAPGTPTVAALTLLSSAPQLSSDAADVNSGVTLTAVTKDASNNVLSGQTVAFAADSGAIIVTQSSTDTSGRALAVLTTDGDPRNRVINLTATSGTLSSRLAISVIGTTLSVSGPANTQRNVATTYTLALTDAGGAGISGITVQLSTNAGNSLSVGGATVTSVTTNASGQASFTLTATEANSTITATGLGLTTTSNVTVSTDEFGITSPADDNTVVDLSSAGTGSRAVTVRWLQSGSPVPNGTVVNFSTTRGTLSASSATTTAGEATVTLTVADAGTANLVASSTALTKPSANRAIRFRATEAETVVVQADPAVIATNETADIIAVVRDDNLNLVADKSVEFSLSDISGGTLSSPVAVTNTQGLARVTYQSTSTTTASNGVQVTARARNSDGTTASGQTSLTVGSRALRITLGTGNEIFEPNETTYQLPYSAIVTDAAGNPATNAEFQLSALPSRYFKGFYVLNVDGEFVPNITAECANEDVNRNGILDTGEDLDGDNVLDPGNIASVPRSPTLDASGSAQFNIQYPQDRGNWVEIELTARVTVSGSEATEKAVFTVPISADDAENPPSTIRPVLDSSGNPTGQTRGESPYGHSESCTDNL